MIAIKNSRELALMKEACVISARALKLAGEAVQPGVTTGEIDRVIRGYIAVSYTHLALCQGQRRSRPVFYHDPPAAIG